MKKILIAFALNLVGVNSYAITFEDCKQPGLKPYTNGSIVSLKTSAESDLTLEVSLIYVIDGEVEFRKAKYEIVNVSLEKGESLKIRALERDRYVTGHSSEIHLSIPAFSTDSEVSDSVNASWSPSSTIVRPDRPVTRSPLVCKIDI